MAITYLTYPSTPAFNETPDGIITSFTIDTPCVEDTIVLLHGGMIWKDFTYTDTQTIEFGAAPPSGTEVVISSGYFGTPVGGVVTSDYLDYIAKLRLLVQDNLEVITDAELLTTLMSAVLEYSKIRPVVAIEDLSGNDTYELSLPTDWEGNISKLISIEKIFDADDGEHIELLDPSLYKIYNAPDRTVILGEEWFGTYYTYRVKYTETHIFTPEVVTIPEEDRNTVLYFAASEACEVMSTYANQNVDMTLSGATVDRSARKSESEIWLDLSRHFLKKWKFAMGIPEKTQTPGAITSITWKRDNSNMLFHN